MLALDWMLSTMHVAFLCAWLLWSVGALDHARHYGVGMDALVIARCCAVVPEPWFLDRGS